jgi:CubicO group peptidase (beta-lactamase class C family)
VTRSNFPGVDKERGRHRGRPPRIRSLRRVAVIVLALPALLGGGWLLAASVLYSPEYVTRMILWQESDVYDYLTNFPQSPLPASPDPRPFTVALNDDRVGGLLESALAVEDLDSFLALTHTQSLIVVHDDSLVLERYANGWRRDSMVTSFSVAKSFVSTLVGIAIDEGAIGGLDDPITTYLPELADRDERFDRITIRHLLQMTSGLEYQESGWFLFNGDDPLTTYHPDQRKLALTNTRIARPPGEIFNYNKYHPQLLGMILERSTGMSVTAWTQSRLWDPLGMEFDGAWTLDSEASGFEKMEAGLNARPIDFAKLGQLFLHDGTLDGTRVVSPRWVATATGVDPNDRVSGGPYGRFYGLMWWGLNSESGTPDFYAAGDHGQFIYVSAEHEAVIVRTGVEYGVSSLQWTTAFGQVAEGL